MISKIKNWATRKIEELRGDEPASNKPYEDTPSGPNESSTLCCADIEFTFGIITDGKSPDRLMQVIESIESNNIPCYEIIVVGGSALERKNTRHQVFDEGIKPGWITKKKNTITQLARYEQIVYLHDYIILDRAWYQGYVRHGANFKVCINRVQNPDGTRFRDLSLFPAFNEMHLYGLAKYHKKEFSDTFPGTGNHECLIPYSLYNENSDLRNWVYVSGAYWVATKHVMREFPLNENLGWGQAEDVAWSEEVKTKYPISFNHHSVCTLIKHKDPIFKPMSRRTVRLLQSLNLLR